VRITFLTVGDLARRTGGYLYHAEVHARLRQRGHRVDEIVLSAADEAAQRRAAPHAGALVPLDASDVIIVDALARIVCAPWLAQWQAQRPLVAMIHELPSLANASGAVCPGEVALLAADALITVSAHGAATLVAHGAPPEAIIQAPGGFDRLISATREQALLSATADRRPQPVSVPLAVNRLSSANVMGAVAPGAAQRPLRTQPPYRALCVAQWIPRKQIRELVQAWHLAAPAGWTLDLVGETTADPAYTASIHTALAEASSASIQVHGAISDAALAVAYADADLFVLPSRFEGYGIVFAEALAHGLPVIACATGPLPELLGSAALLVPPDDLPALTHAIAQLTTTPHLRTELAAAARSRIATLPTWEQTTDQYLVAIHHALQRRSSSG
jgi:glycosyltransferase involved in cell wall biosynthesis